MKKLKRNKATGADDLPTGLLKDCASEISQPLCHLINLSLNRSEIPSDWKHALITKIFKSDFASDNDNYRPISILPILSKILEKSVWVKCGESSTVILLRNKKRLPMKTIFVVC